MPRAEKQNSRHSKNAQHDQITKSKNKKSKATTYSETINRKFSSIFVTDVVQFERIYGSVLNDIMNFSPSFPRESQLGFES